MGLWARRHTVVMAHDEAMHPWPPLTRAGRRRRVGVVTVNWNTGGLIARLLFGLFNVVGRDTIREVVVVDNGSTDGSLDLLRHLADREVIDLVCNQQQRYHGPALTQGVNRLAERARSGTPVDLVWALDSDVLILRSDVVEAAAAAMTRFGAVLAADPDDYNDSPAHVTNELLGACSTLFDPTSVWQTPHRPFLEDGEPSRELQRDLVAAGQRILAFPFCRDGYVLHLGRATLDRVVQLDARDNRYYRWARTHSSPHYALRPDGAELYARHERCYRAAVPDDRPETLARALSQC